MNRQPRPFLTARWEHLVLINYPCPGELLAPLVPRGTVLDLWQGEALVSLVGFLFRDTRLLGLRIPCHVTFEEVNLRFYVRGSRRQASFGAPWCSCASSCLARRSRLVARWVYNEPYLAVPMEHHSSLDERRGGTASYSWRYRDARFAIAADAAGPARPPASGSEAEFITEHYWGYTRQRNGATLEYQVEHPAWAIWEATRSTVTGPLSSLYGAEFGDVLSRPHRSAFVAVGSPVSVNRGRRLSAPESGS